MPQTLSVPQKFALWAREQAQATTAEAGIAVANRMRARKGLPPMGAGLPDCCTPPPLGWKPGDPVRVWNPERLGKESGCET